MADVAIPVSQPRGRRAPRVLARALARERWPLLAIVVAAAAWTIWFVLQCQQYFIQPDELEYVKQSRRIAEQLHPILPGDRSFTSWSQLQPLLLAPVWAIGDTNVAHQVMGVVNALLMASAAIPAWLLARRVVPGERWAPPLVALLTVAVPWMAAASTMMTEVAAYPAFLWAVLAVVNAVARPSPRADALALLGIAVAFFARPQFAALAGALAVAVVAQAARDAATRAPDDVGPRGPRVRRRLREALVAHRLLAVVALAALVVYAVARPDVFGGYAASGVTEGVIDAPGLLDFSREILAYVVVGVGVLPLAMAAGWALATLRRPAGRDQHAFAVVGVVAIAALTVAVGSFTARYTPNGINSRYLFYIAPLLFVGAAALVADRRRAALPLALGGLLAGWVVWGSQLAQAGPSLVSPDQTFHTVLEGRSYQLGRAIGLPELSVPHLLAVAALAAVAALVVAVRRGHGRAAGAVALAFVVAWCAAETAYSLRKIAETQQGVDAAFVEGRTWIDRRLPDGAEAEVLLSTFGDADGAMGVWWDVSFWNAQAGRSMVTPVTPDLQQPYPSFYEVDPETGRFQGMFGDPPPGEGLGPGPWFVRGSMDRTFGFAGERIVEERHGVRLVEVAVPARAAWGLFRVVSDTGRLPVPPRAAFLRVYRADAGEMRRARLTVAATADAQAPTRIAAAARGGWRAGATLAPGESRTFTAPLRWTPEGWADVDVRAFGPRDALPTVEVVGVELLG